MDLNLTRMFAAVQEFRAVDPDMHGNTIAAFLVIALKDGGINQRDLMAQLGIESSAASRHAAILSSDGYTTATGKRRDGLGLIELRVDPNDRRLKHCCLTPAGKALVKRITMRLGG